MAKKPSGLGRGLDELLEDNTVSRRPHPNAQKPLVEAKDEFISQRQSPPSAPLYQTKVKPLYNTPRPTLKSNFKNNVKK